MSSDSDSSLSENNDELPPEIVEAAKEVVLNLLPESSKRLYVACYDQFKSWRSAKNTSSFKEEVFLVYFKELEKTLSPSALWVKFSMLKSTIKTFDNVDIGMYHKLIARLKRINAHHKKKKSKVFTSEEIDRFLNDAPFDNHLSEKVALIFGICGALRRSELTNLKINDVKDNPETSTLLIEIMTLKNRIIHSFMITGNFYKICKIYINARPLDLKSAGRFFLFHRNNKCTGQSICINTIGAMPKKIATWLGLPDPELYTGHTFRRTAKTLLADGGGNITDLKRLGGWKSTAIAESYVAVSLHSKKEINNQITESINSKPSTSHMKKSEEHVETNVIIEEPESVSQLEHSLDPTSVINDKEVLIDFNNYYGITSTQNAICQSSPKKQRKDSALSNNAEQTQVLKNDNSVFNFTNCTVTIYNK